MAAKKKEKTPRARIPAGGFNIYGESVANIVERLMGIGFILADLDEVTIEQDWSGCYYESDSPSIKVEWKDIF